MISDALMQSLQKQVVRFEREAGEAHAAADRHQDQANEGFALAALNERCARELREMIARETGEPLPGRREDEIAVARSALGYAFLTLQAANPALPVPTWIISASDSELRGMFDDLADLHAWAEVTGSDITTGRIFGTTTRHTIRFPWHGIEVQVSATTQEAAPCASES